MKIVKFTNGNGEVTYKVKTSAFFNIFNIFYYYKNGELGVGDEFSSFEDAQHFLNSFKIKKETIK